MEFNFLLDGVFFQTRSDDSAQHRLETENAQATRWTDERNAQTAPGAEGGKFKNPATDENDSITHDWSDFPVHSGVRVSENSPTI